MEKELKWKKRPQMESIIIYLFVHASFFILLIGWLLDLIFGDPSCLPHPVVYMGKWISYWEHRLNKGTHRILKGAIFSVVSILFVYGLTYGIGFILGNSFLLSSWIKPLNWVGLPAHLIFFSILTFFCLAGHTLRKEVRLVFEAVNCSLDEGRKQVARIVGRDTKQLSAQEVRTAALETLAENLSDGVVAPLFWFGVLGVPGMVTYKMINTLDSMIGYQNPRYKDFGCWAARIDDVANYVPARITALLILLANVLLRCDVKTLPSHLSFLFRFANKHASPNSGWPEAALASVLDCQFGGTHNYFGVSFYKPHIGTNPRQLHTPDMQRSLQVCFLAEILAVAILSCFLYMS